jgi:hypothetical protein
VRQIAELPRLEQLDLSGTRVTDACLADLQKARRLQYLVLRGTGVTDAAIAGLNRIPVLSVLDVGDTKISEEKTAVMRKRGMRIFSGSSGQPGHLRNCRPGRPPPPQGSGGGSP